MGSLVWSLVIFLLHSLSPCNSLELLSPEDILSYVRRQCVVLIDSGKPHTTVLQHMEQLERSLRGKVLFGVANFTQLGARKHLTLSIHNFVNSHQTELSSGVFVLFKAPKDRSCLMTDILNHVMVRGAFYDGPMSAEILLDFVNVHCDSFWNLSGDLSVAGLHRTEILDGLFHNFSGPTVEEIHRRCPNLAQFWLTGLCEGSSQRDQQKQEDVCLKEESCTADANPATTMEVPRCEVLTEMPTHDAFFHEYLSKSKPVVIKNAVRQWTAFTEWTNDFFRSRFGSVRAHIKLTPSVGEFEGVEPRSWWTPNGTSDVSAVPLQVWKALVANHVVVVRPEGVDMLLGDFLDLVEKRQPNSSHVSAYLEYTSIKEFIEELSGDLIEPAITKDRLFLERLNIWLSDGNTLGKLHFDQFDNLLCQISGRKQLILFEPFNNSNMYEGHIQEAMLRYKNGTFHRDKLMESTAMTMAPMDIVKPNFEKFPNFAQAKPLNCTIGPGDLLYLPAFWWHEVQSYPDSTEKRNLAVNYWYKPFLVKEFPCQECSFEVNYIYRDLL